MSETRERIAAVTGVAGSQVTAAFHVDPSRDADQAQALSIGTLVRMRTPVSTVFGVVGSLHTESAGDMFREVRGQAEIDLLGEAMDPEPGEQARFQRGVSVYPILGSAVTQTVSGDIAQVYATPAAAKVEIGAIYQDESVPAYLMVDSMLSKHAAVLGTTGSGKSCTVALVLRSILTAHGNGHVMLIDPHNEYAAAFGDLAEVVDISSLQLPYWLLDFEEAVAVLVRGGGVAEREAQVAILRDVILQAKRLYAGEHADHTLITVDTPVPYRLGDMIQLIDRAMGKLDKPDNSIPYMRLKLRLESLTGDRRFSFMFPGRIIRDNLQAILSRLLRIPVAGRPLTIIDTSGVPSEVVDVVVSVLCRVLFDFALWGDRKRTVPILLVCEEAHRYVPAGEQLGFGSTKLAISRIAREGRKYGVSLCLVSQRPSELDPSILSQCGTLFALRMNNEADQNFVARALPENAHGLLSVLPELRVQEALVVGEGVTVPMRVRLSPLAAEHQPRSENARFSEAWQVDREDIGFVAETVQRWRQQRRDRPGTEPPASEAAD